MSDIPVHPRLREMRHDPRGTRLKRKIEECGGTEPETIEIVRIPTRVIGIEERKERFDWKKGDTDTEGVATYSERSLGWWALLEGSREWMFVGAENPGFTKNDIIFISIQKELPK